MDNKYNIKDVGKRKIAVINLLEDDGEIEYNKIVNDKRHWIKAENIQIISHERANAIYAVVQYYVIDVSKAETPTVKSPMEIVEQLKQDKVASVDE